MKIAVIGGGSWGTALAALLAQKGNEVFLWAYEKEVVEAIRSDHQNRLYLPDLTLPKNLFPSQDMHEVLGRARAIVFAVPSLYARKMLDKMAPLIPPRTPIISTTKGIETKSLLLTSEVIRESLGRNEADDQIAILSGPSFAREVVLGYPTAVTIATPNRRLGLRIQHLFATPSFRLFLSDDRMGVQLGGALKNVIAIAAGGSDGLGFGFNTKAILMARGLSEISHLGRAMGADVNTFYGLSGLGDLFLTCSGALSRNRNVGEELGKGKSLDQILGKMKMVAEGVATTKSAYALSQKYRVKMPIVHEVYRVLFEQKSPRAAMTDLMAQAYGTEIPQ